MAPPTVIASSPVYFYCTPNLITIADVGPAMGQIPNKQKKARNKRHTRRGLGQPQITSSVHRQTPQFCSHVFHLLLHPDLCLHRLWVPLRCPWDALDRRRMIGGRSLETAGGTTEKREETGAIPMNAP